VHSSIRVLSVVMVVVCATISSAPSLGHAQEAKRPLEQRVAQLERLVKELQQRLSELEARLAASPAKTPRVANPADWSEKTAWRKLRKGMTMDEVTSLIGEAEKVSSQPLIVFWYWGYPGGGQVEFDADTNLVVGWSEP